ncbi:MAG: MFS transporter [Oscillospiraceae bacterium]|nr:MFS transporter [Oscillospiraceae bacterium]
MVKDRTFNTVSIAIYFLMGSFLAANQSLVSNIAASYGAGEREMGYMISSLYGGSVVAVLIFGELAQRLGKRRASLLTSFAVCAGSFLVLISSSPLLATIGLFIYGAGVGGFESCVMALLTDNNGENSNRFLNFLQALFSGGAVLSPLIIAALFKEEQFRPFYAFVLACYAAFACYFAFGRRIDSFARQPEAMPKGLAFLKLIKHPLIIVYMLCMMIYLGSETAFTYWIGSYLEGEGLGLFSAGALSAYWFSSIFGRLIGTQFSSPSNLMAPCFLLAAAGCVSLVFVPGGWLKLLSVILVGLGFAPLYAGLALLAGTLFPSESASAFSLMIFSSALGGIAFQPFISLLISSGEAKGAYFIIAALCALCAPALRLAARRRAEAGI